MRPSVLLAQLALCASSANAFFPYDPDWRRDVEQKRSTRSQRTIRGQEGRSVRMGIRQRAAQNKQPISERAAREAARLVAKYSGQDIPSDSELAKRANEYDVMEAVETKGKFTEGVNQDGTDYSYFIEVDIGSKKKPMYMLIDTGAGSSWVMGADCTSKACAMHNTFGPDDSDSLELINKPFNIAYGSGKVSGVLAKDNIHVAGMDLEYQFGLATNTSDQFVQFAFDGILGLAMNKGANENFLSTLEASGNIDKNIFCIALNRASDGTNEGEISFGSPNPDKYSGKITYTSLPDDKDNDWAIKMDDMGYNGKDAGIGGIRTFIDTGTSFMFGSSENVKKLHALIPGAESSDDTTYKVPCDSKGNLTVTFSGVDYVISPKDWVSPPNKEGECTSNIYGYEVVQGAWLLGDTFIKNVYAIFDADERRIGFASNVITSGSDKGSSKTKSSSSTSSAKATKTADDSEETGVSALPDSTATSGPDVGLGKESITTGTATSDASQSSETKDSSAPTGLLSQARFTFIFCIVPFFALLV
ncbi:hypothetical protein BHE90_002131 [Fusarium euwallaceae]|uniref:Peptidase A1 domain-containing protein n=1 Tax=Fusarium euwallaceae TaxID=1147111 RepID=A0A430M5L9_9HYPO|nr:hypothetical protein BHE90_002131 [Fusarium euwallaceae]